MSEHAGLRCWQPCSDVAAADQRRSIGIELVEKRGEA
jgi:hypothetical protein